MDADSTKFENFFDKNHKTCFVDKEFGQGEYAYGGSGLFYAWALALKTKYQLAIKQHRISAEIKTFERFEDATRVLDRKKKKSICKAEKLLSKVFN